MKTGSFPTDTCARCGHLDSIHDGGTGPCVPDCKYACDGVTKPGLRETSVRTHVSVAMMLAHHWASDCAIDLTDPHERELERRIAEALRTVEREALERAAKLFDDGSLTGKSFQANGDSCDLSRRVCDIIAATILSLSGDTSHDR